MTYYELLFKKKVRPEYIATSEKTAIQKNKETHETFSDTNLEVPLTFSFEMEKKAESPLSVAC